MRAILLLLMVAAGCGDKGTNTFELDLAVNAPQAASAVVDGTATIAAVGGIYSRGFPKASDAAQVRGTIATLNADGSTRSTVAYEYGVYCATAMPLIRQTNRFVEALDANGAPVLALDKVECEKNDGSGVIVTP